MADAHWDQFPSFQQMPQVDLAAAGRDTTASACGSGVVRCGAVATADKNATLAVQTYLTHMAQGVAGYREVVAGCADHYRGGEEYTRERIEQSCRYDGTKALPDVAPVLHDAPPPPPAPA